MTLDAETLSRLRREHSKSSLRRSLCLRVSASKVLRLQPCSTPQKSNRAASCRKRDWPAPVINP